MDQAIQIELLDRGCIDSDSDGIDNRDPLSLLILKEQVEQSMDNPCIGCIHDDTTDKYIKSYCHTSCKEDVVESILLVDEV